MLNCKTIDPPAFWHIQQVEKSGEPKPDQRQRVVGFDICALELQRICLGADDGTICHETEIVAVLDHGRRLAAVGRFFTADPTENINVVSEVVF